MFVTWENPRQLAAAVVVVPFLSFFKPYHLLTKSIVCKIGKLIFHSRKFFSMFWFVKIYREIRKISAKFQHCRLIFGLTLFFCRCSSLFNVSFLVIPRNVGKTEIYQVRKVVGRNLGETWLSAKNWAIVEHTRLRFEDYVVFTELQISQSIILSLK